MWTVSTIIFKHEAEGMKNSSYFPKNWFASSECAQMRDNSVPSVNSMGSLQMGPNQSSHFLCIQWQFGVCEKCFHPWELGVKSPGLPWEVQLGGIRSPQQAVPPSLLGGATLCPTVNTERGSPTESAGPCSCKGAFYCTRHIWAEPHALQHPQGRICIPSRGLFWLVNLFLWGVCVCVPAPGEGMLFPNGHLDTTCLENAGHGSGKVKFFLCRPF